MFLHVYYTCLLGVYDFNIIQTVHRVEHTKTVHFNIIQTVHRVEHTKIVQKPSICFFIYWSTYTLIDGTKVYTNLKVE